MAYFPRELETESQKAPQRDPREAKMVPRSAPGGPRRPQEAPRAPQDGPKSRQERPKSRPEPVSERPGWPPGPHLAPKKPPEASRKPFWLPRGSISAPPGFHFRSFRRFLRSLPGGKRKRKRKRKCKRKRKQKSHEEPRAAGRKASRPQRPGGYRGAP